MTKPYHITPEQAVALLEEMNYQHFHFGASAAASKLNAVLDEALGKSDATACINKSEEYAEDLDYGTRI